MVLVMGQPHQFMNVGMGMNMMPQDYNYMMNARMYESGSFYIKDLIKFNRNDVIPCPNDEL